MSKLSFISFANNQEFHAWQEKNPNAGIFSMSPVAGNFNVTTTDIASNLDAAMTFGLFVVYRETESPNWMTSTDIQKD